jgi:hypothetical protein
MQFPPAAMKSIPAECSFFPQEKIFSLQDESFLPHPEIDSRMDESGPAH